MRIPDPPWLRPRERRRRPNLLDRPTIVAAALRIAQAEGFSALSMRRLGAELGTGTTSVYWHVRDKAQLIDVVVDEIVGRIEVPTEGSAEERLMGAAHNARRVLLSYPGAAQEFAQGRLTSGPNSMLMHESLMALLAETGVAVPVLWDAYLSLLTYLIGQVLPESWGSGDVDEERGRQTAEWVASLPFDQLPTIDAVAKHPTMAFEERFEFGLRAFLVGLRASSQVGTSKP